MSQLYDCIDEACENNPYMNGLGEVIEHLRDKHGLKRYITRPSALGNTDSHEHVWYCDQCDDRTGKGHKSFDSHRAMWQHLQSRHVDDIRTIKLE